MAIVQTIAPEIDPSLSRPPMSTGPPTGCGPEMSGVQSWLSWVLIELIAKPLGLLNRTAESQSALRTNERRRLLSWKPLDGLFRLHGNGDKEELRLPVNPVKAVFDSRSFN